MKAVFLFITSISCNACNRIKEDKQKGWDHIKSCLSQNKDLEIIEITLPSFSMDGTSDKYPIQLKKYIQWVPMCMLVPSYKFHNSDKYELKPYIYSGVWDEKIQMFKLETEMIDYTAESITRWVRETTNSKDFLEENGIDVHIFDNGVLLGSFKTASINESIEQKLDKPIIVSKFKKTKF